MRDRRARGARYRESAGNRRAARRYQRPPRPRSHPRPHPPVASPPPSEMVAGVLCALPLAAAIAIAAAHPRSHDNILRVQLWDAEGLSREPATAAPAPAAAARSSRVDSRLLYEAMLAEGRGGPGGRSQHHRVRHKRRRARRSGGPAPAAWRFHAGTASINVLPYDEDATERDAAAPQPQLAAEPAPDAKGTTESPPAVVRKCCPNGKNLSEEIDGKRECQLSTLTFQPLFYDSDEKNMWIYDSNLFETIVDGNPCLYDRYKLEPEKYSNDEYYLLVNGSLFMPHANPLIVTTKEYCMEMFWSPDNPAGLTVPMLCFPEPVESNSTTLIVYAAGLIISLPFLLATICVYTFISELRTSYGKCLACHCACLATAFSCLAATQLGGHAFPQPICTIMACLIQFSFVSCFFWLNVMCFDTLWTVKSELNLIFTTDRAKMRRQFAWYCLYAFLLPLVLLAVTVIMQLSPAVPSTYLKPNFGVIACWFETDKAALPFFYGPVAFSLLVNLVLFILTSRNINRLRNDPESSAVPMIASNATPNSVQPTSMNSFAAIPQNNITMGNFSERLKRHRKKFRMSLYLCILMSLSWVMEVASWAAGAESGPSVWSIFDMLNALQGLFIFVIYVLQKPVRTRIKWCRRSMPDNTVLLHVASEPSVFENGRKDDV